MAGTSLLALIDDIATLLDDVSVLTKVAAKKTAGVLGDDVALNAQQVSGVRAKRELPVVWAVFKGSALNKLVLVPSALSISAFLPWLITPLLMVGGAFLCFEGFEKLAHKFLHSKEEDKAAHDKKLKALLDPETDLVEFERRKIKGAIRTDFILSAEIVVIALGTVQNTELMTRIAVVTAIATLMTLGVYSLVAGIVKLDDLGLNFLKKQGASAWAAVQRSLGRFILRLAPVLMKSLSALGTAAMFLVGGGILIHGMPPAEALSHSLQEVALGLSGIGDILAALTPVLISGFLGFVVGGLVLVVVSLLKRLWPFQAAKGY